MDGYELISKLIAVIVTASRKAAKAIRKIKKNGELNVKDKRGIEDIDIKAKDIQADYVTEADTESQKIIVQYLKAHFPNLKFCGEENVS